MGYAVAKYKGRWALYCSGSQTWNVYEGKNKKTKKQLDELAERLNKRDRDYMAAKEKKT